MAKVPIFKAILDACVLYPAPVRDILLSFAGEGLFQPKWTGQIQEEWIRNLLINRPDLTRSQLEALVQTMNTAFPDANVIEYEDRIELIELPDKDDRHVVAASIISESRLIITFNLKDFPSTRLKRYGVEALHPDDFLVELFNIDGHKGYQAFEKQVNRLKNPPVESDELLRILTKSGLPKTATVLKNVR
jgi:hypothetical protein